MHSRWISRIWEGEILCNARGGYKRGIRVGDIDAAYMRFEFVYLSKFDISVTDKVTK